VQLECEVTQPDLVSPSILITLEDSLGRIRAVAPVHLKPHLVGAVPIRRPHEFVALTGPNLSAAGGIEVSGALEINDDLRAFTLVLYQSKESPFGAPKEGLRATFSPKRAIAAG
jgi:hypothetical protein